MQLLWPLCKGYFVPCRIGTRRQRQDPSLTGRLLIDMIVCLHNIACRIIFVEDGFMRFISSCLHVWHRMIL